MKYHGLLAIALATPNVAMSEPIDLACNFGVFGGSIGLRLDQDEGEFALVGSTGVASTRIPYMEITDRLIFAYWLGENSGSLNTLSLDILSGAVALGQVGGQDGDRQARSGTCSRRN